MPATIVEPHPLMLLPLMAMLLYIALLPGALTYIGNSQNFLVRSTVQQARLHLPAFFDFLKYSLPVFAPVLGLIWFFTLR
jgi:Na+/H+ antiporter NhaD/arsenite permease-like protein